MKYLQPDTFFHIFNRANGNEKLFRSDANYRYFIKQWIKYIDHVAATYAYCLMPNHFHALVKIHNEKMLMEYFAKKNDQSSDFPGLLSKQFSNFFNSYAKGYNKMHKRKGSLFIRPFKAKKITDDSYLSNIIHYIHFNPLNHSLATNLSEWPYCSYWILLSDERTFLSRKEIIRWFGNKKEFVKFHQQPANLTGFENLSG